MWKSYEVEVIGRRERLTEIYGKLDILWIVPRGRYHPPPKKKFKNLKLFLVFHPKHFLNILHKIVNIIIPNYIKPLNNSKNE